MLKLNENIVEFLKKTVKPDCVDRLISDIERNATYFMKGQANHVPLYKDVTDIKLSIYLTGDDFHEELETHIWYPREKFDGNPNDYILIEMYDNGSVDAYSEKLHRLSNITTHFMYIERPQDEQPE